MNVYFRALERRLDDSQTDIETKQSEIDQLNAQFLGVDGERQTLLFQLQALKSESSEKEGALEACKLNLSESENKFERERLKVCF